MDRKTFEQKMEEQFPDSLEGVREKYGKFVEQKHLRQLINLARDEKKKIITTNGTFDLLHEGHLRGISEAKKSPEKDGVPEENTILIVFVNTDDSVEKYKKIKPVHSENERLKAVAELPFVDFVCLMKDTTPNSLLEITRSNYHVKGSEYDSKDEDLKIPGPTEQEIVEKYGGKMIFVERPADSISSGKIRRKRKYENIDR